MRIREEQGNITLAGQCVVPFRTGTLELEVQIGTEIQGQREQSQKERVRLEVSGERFMLPENRVDSVYPAQGGICGSPGILPHLVLNSATQPFECTVGEEKQGNLEIPYLALFLFYEEEFPLLHQATVDELFQLPDSRTAFFPEPYKASEKETVCCFMDISMDLFWNIAPRLTELPMLVHGRVISPELKCMQADTASITNLRSVVICNRLPKYGTQQQPARNRVCLVSLEGCGKALKEKQQCYDKIRLPVLYHWEFTAAENPYADVGLEQVYTKGMGMTVPGTEAFDSPAGEILANGYVPLLHTFREGSRLVSFYRGPLTPEKTSQKQREADSPDGLYRYDPEIGMFDVSYAAAWQLGTLLALSKESIAKKILFLRTNMLQNLRRREGKRLLEQYGVQCADEANPEALKEQMLEWLKEYYKGGA